MIVYAHKYEDIFKKPFYVVDFDIMNANLVIEGEITAKKLKIKNPNEINVGDRIALSSGQIFLVEKINQIQP